LAVTGGIMMRMVEGKTLAATPWPVRAVLVLLPLFLATFGIATAIHLNGRGDKWPDALASWAIGWFFALIFVAVWELARGRSLFGRRASEQPRWRRSEIFVLAGILLAATFLRVVALDDYPVALHNDEMTCMIEARGFLGKGPGLFGVGWFNCPNLGFFLTSLPLRVLGQTLFALRLGSAILGLLSLVAVYLIARRLFGVRPAMLLLIMTTPFHWHLHYSRTGFHYMQAASLTAIAIWLFVLAFDRRSPALFGCAGVVTGIACQTYYAAWLTPIILVTWVASRALSDRAHVKTAMKGLVVTIVFLVVTLAPLLSFYAEMPDYATSRPSNVFLFSEYNKHHVADAYGTTDSRRLLVKNAGRLLGFFFGGFGDSAHQYGLQHQFIDPFLLLFFTSGLAYSLTLIRTPGGQLLWIWFLGTVIAGGLLTIDAPFSPRLIGISPIVMLFPALLIDWILRLPWIGTSHWRTVGFMGVATLLITGSAWWNLDMTFVRYPKEHFYHARDYITRLAIDLRWVRSIANFGPPELFDHQAYTALIPHIDRQNIDTWAVPYETVADLIEPLPSRTLVIAHLNDADFIELCQQMGADRTGTVMAHKEPNGFRWCYIERSR
jgi:4-amino-4-deoxy-L-arabinose transferase-like glycosyltransferase